MIIQAQLKKVKVNPILFTDNSAPRDHPFKRLHLIVAENIYSTYSHYKMIIVQEIRFVQQPTSHFLVMTGNNIEYHVKSTIQCPSLGRGGVALLESSTVTIPLCLYNNVFRNKIMYFPNTCTLIISDKHVTSFSLTAKSEKNNNPHCIIASRLDLKVKVVTRHIVQSCFVSEKVRSPCNLY